jgi:cytochrome c peroxidase
MMMQKREWTMGKSSKDSKSDGSGMPVSMARKWAGRGAGLAVILALALPLACSKDTDGFSAEEWDRIKMITPLSEPQLPNPSNLRNENDEALVKFGQKLFWDKDFAEAITVAGPSGNVGEAGKISCAVCHGHPYFGDARPFPQSHGRTGWLAHNTPAMINLGYYKWTFWTGRFDSMAEHGAVALGGAGTQMFTAKVLYRKYKDEYNALFPDRPLPAFLDPMHPDAAKYPATGSLKGNGAAADGPFDRMSRADQWEIHWLRANVGRSFDAYPRALVTRDSPFEKYVRDDQDARKEANFNARAKNGLRLFIGKASCIDCHHGPALTDNKFHNVGVQDLTALPTGSTTMVNPDRGRAGALVGALNNQLFLNRTNRMIPVQTDQWPVFSGAGQFSDDPDSGLQRLIDEDKALCVERNPEANATTCGLLFKGPNPTATPPVEADPRYNTCIEANAEFEACVKYSPAMEGVFRTPSLLSIAMTAPYFHTGEARTLRSVVEHYNKGGGAHGSFVGTKSARLRPLLLTESEIDDVVEFLMTLTGKIDPSLTCNPLVDIKFDPITMRGCGPPGAGAPTGGASGSAGAGGGGRGGASGGGGMTGAGGVSGTGGAGSGGMASSGGAPGSGGAPSSGGAPGSGGAGVGGAAGGSAGGGG